MNDAPACYVGTHSGAGMKNKSRPPAFAPLQTFRHKKLNLANLFTQIRQRKITSAEFADSVVKLFILFNLAHYLLAGLFDQKNVATSGKEKTQQVSAAKMKGPGTIV